jgi:hypothetical protein
MCEQYNGSYFCCHVSFAAMIVGSRKLLFLVLCDFTFLYNMLVKLRHS